MHRSGKHTRSRPEEFWDKLGVTGWTGERVLSLNIFLIDNITIMNDKMISCNHSNYIIGAIGMQ